MEHTGHRHRHTVHSGYNAGRSGIKNHTDKSDHHPSNASNADS